MKRAGDILKLYLEKGKINKNSKRSDIFSRWTDIIGKNFSLHIKIKELEKKTIIIEVDHPGWYQKVKFQETEILKKIKSLYKELDIRNIKIMLKMKVEKEEKKEPEKFKNDINSEEYKNFVLLLNRLKKNGEIR